MKFDDIVIFEILAGSGQDEVRGGVAALKRKNTAKDRRVCVVHCQATGKTDLIEATYSSNAVITSTERGNVTYDGTIGIYVVGHITGFPDNLAELIHQHLRGQSPGQGVKIGYLCLVVCNLAEDTRSRPLPATISAASADKHVMTELIRGLLLKRLFPSQVSAFAKSVFIHYHEGSGTPPGDSQGTSYDGRKWTALVTGGKPGHFHDYPGARKHKIRWAYEPGTGAYRMGGQVEDAVLSADILTNTVSNAAVASTPPKRPSAALRPAWVPDDQRGDCTACGKAFGTFRRRHHCRQCGEIFCDSCSDWEKVVQRPVAEPGKPRLQVSAGKVRVCWDCFHTI